MAGLHLFIIVRLLQLQIKAMRIINREKAYFLFCDNCGNNVAKVIEVRDEKNRLLSRICKKCLFRILKKNEPN